MKTPDPMGLRLRSLDALRGVCALIVVLWHWQHMWLLGSPTLVASTGVEIDRTTQPFYQALKTAYEHGYLAVNIFFVISGFIFFHLYRTRISDGAIRAVDFSILRFSRLYPLHVATLILVALLQARFFSATNEFFVYPANDPPHFILSLLFVQFTNDQAAFNGPTWSLTIEIVMYALFFTLARGRLINGSIGPLMVVLIGIACFWLNESIAQGLTGFFAGGLAYGAFTWARKSKRTRLILGSLLVLTACGWALTIYLVYDNHAADRLLLVLPAGRNMVPKIWLLCGLFPLTVVTVALHEAVTQASYAGLKWLGDISYSSYLIHFPLQLCIAIAFSLGLVSVEFIRSEIALVVFFGLLIPLSALIYRAFEVPCQNVLRQAFGSSRVSSA